MENPSSDAAFLRAIQEDRDNPFCRSVYADWLEEQGDPRGEYLRLGCRLAELREQLAPSWLSATREGRFQEAIPLSSGRVVRLRELRQFGVYEGLLEGRPTTELNANIVERIVNQERERSNDWVPYLIEPEIKFIDDPSEENHPSEQSAFLPSVACVGRFQSSASTRGSAGDYSELVVIWFQDSFALPIDQKTWGQLVAIDWDQAAADYDY